jgi:hypothetical protein
MLPHELFSKQLLEIYDTVALALKTGEIDDAAEALIALDGVKREIAEMFDQTKNTIIELMGDAPEHEVSGFVLEKKNGSPRKSWDHHTLGEVVAQRLIDMATDMDTGELVRRPIEIALEMLAFAAPSYWRVGELNKIGVNADNYCEVGEPKASIIIRKAS